MKNFLFISLLSLSLRAETITIVADEWCPYNCAEDSQRQGFVIELAKEIFAKNNINVDYKILPWTRAVKEVRAGRYDAVVGAYKEDAPDFIFPKISQSSSGIIAIGKKELSHLKKPKDLLKNKLKVGVINGYSYGKDIDLLKKENEKSFVTIAGSRPLERLTKIIQKDRIDIFLEDKNVYLYFKDSNKNTIEHLKSLKTSPLITKQETYIAFSPNNKNSKKYASILSKGMKELNSSGRLKKILNKYGLNQ